MDKIGPKPPHMARRIVRMGIERYQISKDPIAYARRQGVTVGERCWFVGVIRGTFGSEPELITIGDDVALASGVRFITHDGGVLAFQKEFPTMQVIGRITIGDNVGIGMNTILMPGTTIGDNVIIGAGSVVQGDIPSNSIATGVPARRVMTMDKYRELSLERAFFEPPGTPPDKRQQLFKDFLDGRIDNHGRPID